MITEEVRNSIVEVIGAHPVKKIVQFAKQENFKKEDGDFFNRSTFSLVLNGRREYPRIEDFILKCATHYKKLNEARERKMKEFAESVQKTA